MIQPHKYLSNFSPSGLLSPPGKIQVFLALFLAIVMAFAVGTALGFEHIGGYIPCELCLKERIPYYIGIPLVLLTAILSANNCSGFTVRSLFLIAALFMFYDCALSIYHAGAEYKFWAGPSSCSGGTLVIEDANNLLDSLEKIKPPSCDKAAGIFLGLSFAGWNVVSTFFLGAVALIGAFIKRKNK